MQLKNGWMAVVALAFSTIILAGTAAAQTDHTWDGGGDGVSWTSANNWDTNDVPDTIDDKAIIPNNGASGFTVNLDSNITIGDLDIYEKSVLNIAPNASATLTLDDDADGHGQVVLRATSDSVYAVINVGDGDSAHTGILRLPDNEGSHQIGGKIVLWEDDSVLDIENESVTFNAYDDTYIGAVVGKDSAALVEIDANVVVVNRIVFEGMMRITAESGTGYFTNDRAYTSSRSGMVLANVAGPLMFDSNVVIDDDEFGLLKPTWQASGNGWLEFDREAYWLTGNFVLTDCTATIAFVPVVDDPFVDEFIITTGSLTDGASGDPQGLLEFRGDAPEFVWCCGSADSDTYVGDCP